MCVCACDLAPEAEIRAITAGTPVCGNVAKLFVLGVTPRRQVNELLTNSGNIGLVSRKITGTIQVRIPIRISTSIVNESVSSGRAHLGFETMAVFICGCVCVYFSYAKYLLVSIIDGT